MKFDIARIWYGKYIHPVAILLLPFSILFGICVFIRRFLYQKKILKTERFNMPVIIVGNISTGGTGKTPFVIWLATFLKSQGFKPGIVSRGVGGKKHKAPHQVNADDMASVVGDEALLLYNNTGCPVVICINRPAAVETLLKNNDCNIVISDDGLQHYRLERDLEIVVVDSERRFGNHYLLPAGPLREPRSRLRKTDFVVMHGGNKEDKYTMVLEPLEFVSTVNAEHIISFAEFPRDKIHAVAGIGHPERFFNVLKQAGFDPRAHVFPDHHSYQPRDLDFSDNLPIFMTEKDAVKCAAFADERYWYLRVGTKVNQGLEQALIKEMQKYRVLN